MTAATVAELVLGSTLPRLFTPPLVTGPPGSCGCGCALTPETSYGFDVDDFATRVLEQPLDPWERWLVIHACELLPDRTPRFRKVLVIVARQNGKTHVLVVLSLFWLFVEQVGLVLGTSTNLDYARESWEKAVTLIEETEALSDDVRPRTGVRRANGEQTLTTIYRSRYKIAASNRKGGRSLTVHRLILDELREHQSWAAWNAAYNAMNAVPDAQAFAITNQGDDRSVVLDSLHADGMEMLKSGDGDPELGMFEWSAPRTADPEDVHALAMANPNLGRRIKASSLLADARRAKKNGGEELAQFKTEIMCIRQKLLDPAIDPQKWKDCLDVGDLSAVRDRVALCWDVSIDGLHASLVAAAVLDDGRVRVEPIKAWSGRGCAAESGREVRALVEQMKVKPRAFGWIPNGPAAAAAADVADRGKKGGDSSWPPNGVTVEEIRAEVTAVCMGFAALVDSGQVVHSDDPMLNAHVEGTEKLHQGDAWRFTRRGAGHCDGTYAAAGAVHLARTLPEPIRPRLRRLG